MGSGGGPGRRNLRERKVSQRMAVVDDSTRQQATEARLEALEADNDLGAEQGAGDSDDEEFTVAGDEEEEEEVEMSGNKRKKKKQGGTTKKHRLRTSGVDRGRAPKSFQRILEDAMLERLPQGIPCYTTAAAGPPTIGTPRKFCSVCGNLSTYKCTRCGSRYCCRKCFATHTETRCLKFTV